ncbi:DUF4826 family protein [Pseudoalteromonas sp. BDTF-M6]|uniref:DUF4826 family protein n=1 Tax=Pseudoalteromonas sp. BDTF-M6 TaxID=2796132 RepID=UPI001BAFC6A7|nr:DUF4826 family protein [Pseudoalteromonas sp. BDTF-M6]MBS3796619.1 DUF4826 family protein [Pseudoalteromonas sp. BDTF-M6]
MSQQQEQLAQQEQQIRAFQRHCFETAQKHLAKKGIMPKIVVDKDSRFIAPLCAVWKFKAQNGKTYWVITGQLPADHVEVSAANTAREAIRYFSLQWQVKAEQLLSSTRLEKTQQDFAQLLINRAHGLYELYDKQDLWANEP